MLPFAVLLYCMTLALFIAEYLVALLRRKPGSFIPVFDAARSFQGPKSPTADKEEGRYGFLGRAFQEAKRLGMAIDPEAVAQAEQAWKVRKAWAVDGYVCT